MILHCTRTAPFGFQRQPSHEQLEPTQLTRQPVANYMYTMYSLQTSVSRGYVHYVVSRYITLDAPSYIQNDCIRFIKKKKKKSSFETRY